MSESVENDPGSATGSPNPPPPSPSTPPAPADPRDARIAILTKDLDAARARVDELARAYQASERDKDAFKQRLQRERDQMLEVEKGKVVLVLLEAIDELDLCLTAADKSPLATGVRLIREGLVKKALAGGVERVDLEGTPYDPNLAEATDLQPVTDPSQDGLVLSAERACYRMGSRVIRPGRVTVAKYLKPAQA